MRTFYKESRQLVVRRNKAELKTTVRDETFYHLEHFILNANTRIKKKKSIISFYLNKLNWTGFLCLVIIIEKRKKYQQDVTGMSQGCHTVTSYCDVTVITFWCYKLMSQWCHKFVTLWHHIRHTVTSLWHHRDVKLLAGKYKVNVLHFNYCYLCFKKFFKKPVFSIYKVLKLNQGRIQ